MKADEPLASMQTGRSTQYSSISTPSVCNSTSSNSIAPSITMTTGHSSSSQFAPPPMMSKNARNRTLKARNPGAHRERLRSWTASVRSDLRDDGNYWVPDRNSDEYRTAVAQPDTAKQVSQDRLTEFNRGDSMDRSPAFE